MKASVMDLRYRTKDVLRALEANEEIILTHRGAEKGKIVALAAPDSSLMSISEHPAVGMWSDNPESVPEMIARLRSPRSW
jgi:antitoxin (DNA-binding transcriptional repressor) of toxin-antitoxin stability system